MRSRDSQSAARLRNSVYALCSILGLVACSDDGSSADSEPAGTDTEPDSGVGSGDDPSTTASTGTTGTTGTSATSTGTTDDAGSSGNDSDGDTGEPPIPELSPGCGQPFSDEWLLPYTLSWGAETSRAVVDAAGVEREFLIEFPENLDPDEPLPVVFSFHGQGGTMDNAFGQNINQYFENAIAVYPQGLGNASGTSTWNFNPSGEDAAFFVAMINEIGTRMCVDMNRVFVQGFSRGGMMANFLACIREDIIDGVAPVASTFPSSSDQCTGPVPAFIVHGRNDDIIAFSQGEAVRDAWLNINGCSGEGEATADGCTQWTDCEGRGQVVWCAHDGGHELASNAGFAEALHAFFMSL